AVRADVERAGVGAIAAGRLRPAVDEQVELARVVGRQEVLDDLERAFLARVGDRADDRVVRADREVARVADRRLAVADAFRARRVVAQVGALAARLAHAVVRVRAGRDWGRVGAVAAAGLGGPVELGG